MKLNFLFLNIVFLMLLLSLGTAEASVVQKQITVNNHKWLASFVIKPSKPKSHGQGFCGAGEEITLIIKSANTKKIVWKKLIESCLESIILDGGELGSESVQTLSKVINLDKNPVEIRWLSFKEKADVIGKLDLSKDIPSYVQH